MLPTHWCHLKILTTETKQNKAAHVDAHLKQSAYFDNFCRHQARYLDGEPSIKSSQDNTFAVSKSGKVGEDEDVVVGNAGGVHPGPPRLLQHLGGVQGEVLRVKRSCCDI